MELEKVTKLPSLAGRLGFYVLRASEGAIRGNNFEFVGECVMPDAMESEVVGTESISGHVAGAKRTVNRGTEMMRNCWGNFSCLIEQEDTIEIPGRTCGVKEMHINAYVIHLPTVVEKLQITTVALRLKAFAFRPGGVCLAFPPFARTLYTGCI